MIQLSFNILFLIYRMSQSTLLNPIFLLDSDIIIDSFILYSDHDHFYSIDLFWFTTDSVDLNISISTTYTIWSTDSIDSLSV